MKTATVPNDTMTNQLIDVTAELTVAYEQYEKHIVDHVSERLQDVALKLYSDLEVELGGIPTESQQRFRDCIKRRVLESATEATTFCEIQERSLGLHTPQAPNQVVKRGIEQATTALQYWGQV